MQLGPFVFEDGFEAPTPRQFTRSDGKVICCLRYPDDHSLYSIGLYTVAGRTACGGWNGLDLLTATAVLFELTKERTHGTT